MSLKDWKTERDAVRQQRAEWEDASYGLTEAEAAESPEWLEATERFDDAYYALPWWRRFGL